MTQILSLDDDPLMLEILAKIFISAGFDHLRASDSQEAISIMHQESIDLFTQDIKRPKMDGFTLYQKKKMYS
jgi:DNA-binding response OmpR family regulator